MEVVQRKTGSIILVFWLLITSTAFAQKPTLSADDTHIAPGDPVTITLSTTVRGEAKIDYPLEFTPDYAVSEGMESVMDHATGKVKTSYFVQQRGTFIKKGKYTFYAFVRYKGKNLKSNALTITVSDDELDNVKGPETSDPIYGVIQSSKTVVYEGEPVLLRAKVFSKIDIYHLEGYNPFRIDNNAEEHIFQNQLPNFRREKVNGKDMLTLEFGSQLVFPVKTGKSRVRPFEMALLFHDKYLDRSISLKSAAATLTVKPLPNGTPADFIGGVGTYSIKQIPGKTDLAEGDAFELKLTIEGMGNLHNTNPPVLNLPNGCTVYGDPEREDDYIFTEEGVEGSITYTYNIAIARTGKIAFPAQSISFFDLETERYRTMSTIPFEVNVKADPSKNTSMQSVKPKQQQQALASVAKKADNSFNWLPVLLIAAVLIVGITLWLVFRKPKSVPENTGTPLSVTPTPAIQERNYWQEVLAAGKNAETVSELLPKAILAEINRRKRKNHYSIQDALKELPDAEAAELKEILEACKHYRYSSGERSLDTVLLVSRTAHILQLKQKG